MCLEEFNISEWEREKCDQLVESEKRRYHQMELDKLKSEIEQERKAGIKQGIRETVRNMLEKDMEINLISEISNLSIEEIIKIKESL